MKLAPNTFLFPYGKITKLSPDEILPGPKPLPLWKCTFIADTRQGDATNEDSNDVPENETFTVQTRTLWLSSTSATDRLLEHCLELMIEGEESQWEISTQATTSRVKLKLLSFEGSGELFSLSGEDLLKISLQLKEEGRLAFAQQDQDQAFYKFSSSLKVLMLLDEKEFPKLQQNKIETANQLRNNLALIQSHFNNWQEAVEISNWVLNQDQNNVKALYRRGLAFIELENFEEAERDLKKASDLDSSLLSAVERHLSNLHKKQAKSAKSLGPAMRKFLG